MRSFVTRLLRSAVRATIPRSPPLSCWVTARLVEARRRRRRNPKRLLRSLPLIIWIHLCLRRHRVPNLRKWLGRYGTASLWCHQANSPLKSVFWHWISTVSYAIRQARLHAPDGSRHGGSGRTSFMGSGPPEIIDASGVFSYLGRDTSDLDVRCLLTDATSLVQHGMNERLL